jgi:hypothetical protein
VDLICKGGGNHEVLHGEGAETAGLSPEKDNEYLPETIKSASQRFLLLDSPLDPARFKAAGTDVGSLRGALDKDFHLLDVGLPFPFGAYMGVADRHAGLSVFAADDAFLRHFFFTS